MRDDYHFEIVIGMLLAAMVIVALFAPRPVQRVEIVPPPTPAYRVFYTATPYPTSTPNPTTEAAFAHARATDTERHRIRCLTPVANPASVLETCP